MVLSMVVTSVRTTVTNCPFDAHVILPVIYIDELVLGLGIEG